MILMKNKIVKYISFVFAVQPMLDVYGVGIKGLGLGKVIMIILSLLCILLNVRSLSFVKILHSIPANFKPYLCWGLFVPFIYIYYTGFSYNDLAYKTIAVIGFWLTFGVVCAVVDYKMFFKYFQYAAVFASAGLLLQIALYFVLGFYPPLVVPYLPLATGESARNLFIQYLSEDRPASFFLEPSNYAYYAAAGLVISLFKSEGFRKQKWIIAFLTISLIASRSGSAYLLSFVAYLSYFFFYRHQIPQRIKIRVIGILLLMPVVFTAISSFEVTQSIQERAKEFNNDEDQSSTSGYLRMYRGFAIFSNLSLEEKIIGIGHSNVNMFKNSHQSLMSDVNALDEDGLYLNGFAQILIYNGLIGMALFMIALFPYIKKKETLVFLLLLLASSFISGNYNTDMKLLLIFCMCFFYKN